MSDDVPGIPHAPFSPETPIFRMFVGVIRIRRAWIDAEDPLHSTYDTAYHASNNGADRPSSLVSYRGAVSDASWNALGLGADDQGECENKTDRQCVKFHMVQSSIVLGVAGCGPDRHPIIPPMTPWWSRPPSYPSPRRAEIFARGPRLFVGEILATLECCPLLYLGYAVQPRSRISSTENSIHANPPPRCRSHLS